ncbi:efflux RND transporter periplasmic adaptor subunit [Rhizobium sp. SSA_523]|uniref:efflux RND transporter periplasmic adaptor subunit n=1 Tax=Rhizobium sp. SSA_523 TaxID=2952477 RepID=UPI002091521E|nr:efflux RND transporter periplasmic adaptor subunit [Rhizobium sp. SSA_523]MCO5732500.1 efflux RND transporter periplasmic adaptor subunit [Rhizobium sp. SSA_523]WKC22360.1 efflux RND transporter periplasmic adaptor subunit [Rhizobium sp. SSA_523]
MTSKLANWALWGAGLSTAALISGAAIYLQLPQGANAAAASAAAQAPAVPVTVASVEPRSFTSWQEFSGRLQAIDRVELRPRVSGAIQSVHFREGGLVREGDILFKIDPKPYEAAVREAQGLVASARAKLDLAVIELERGESLASKKTISESELAQRRSNQRDAAASLQSAEAALTVAELNLGYTDIRAPISGRVGKIDVTLGNLVAEGASSTPLTTIVSINPIYASFDASEELIARILSEVQTKDGVPTISSVPVEVRTLDARAPAITGHMQLIDNEVNTASGTIRVRAELPNPDGRLIAGQFVRVRLGQPKPESRLLISEKAVGTDQDKKFVFVVDSANTVTYRPVQLGAAVDGMRVVEEGLATGDRIVVSGLQRIRPGSLVTPETQAELAAK